MSTINFKTRQINNSTPISNIFIEKHLPKANATYVKIYIYLYRFFYTNTQVSLKSIATNLSLLESDVINALKYWEDEGLITLESDEKEKNFCINFINLNDNVKKEEPSDKKPAVSEHTYTPEEIGHILKYNTDIKGLINFIESMYAATFSPKNLSQFINMFDSLNLSMDIYKFLITYVHSKGISNINSMLSYVEKVSVSLCEKNIKTLEEAEKYLSRSEKPKEQTSNYNNKFVNFDQQTRDFEEMRRIEEELLEEDYKKSLEKNRKVD